MVPQTYIQLLRNNQMFRRLWVGQVVSELGSWFNFIAVLGLVRQISNAAPEATTVILLSRLVPFTVFAPFAGAFVDRWSRRGVMLVADIARVFMVLGLLFVRDSEDLWLAYTCTAFLAIFNAFFEAAKNASVPNITGDRDLLPGNALMFSSRFLLMSLGAAMGGWTAATVGYRVAFVVNAFSFLISAFSIWLIPNEATQERRSTEERETLPRRASYWSDIRQGWTFIFAHAPVATIIATNILWATGGGATNLIADRLGGVVFAREGVISGDAAVAAFYFAGGMGLFIGMMIARRVGSYFQLRGSTIGFMGWALIVQGLLFALIGVMPALWLACFLLFISRVLLGAEYAVQETLLMRLVPDNLRGRVSTTDRAAELLIWSLSTAIAGWSLQAITPRTLTVIAGLLSATAGIFWLLMFATGAVRLPTELDSRRRRE